MTNKRNGYDSVVVAVAEALFEAAEVEECCHSNGVEVMIEECNG